MDSRVRFRRDNCLRRRIMNGCGHATVSTELWSQVLSMDGGEVGVFFILQIHRNLFWLVGTMFGWLIPPVVFIAIRTPARRFLLLARVLAFLRTRVSNEPAAHCPHLCLTRSHWNGFDSRLANWLGSDESENNSEA